MGGRNLRARQADETVARLQRVIEECELMIARERREPEREPREIDRHRVAIDAVEALLRDKAPRMQRFVLVGREFWLLRPVYVPGLLQARPS